MLMPIVYIYIRNISCTRVFVASLRSAKLARPQRNEVLGASAALAPAEAGHARGAAALGRVQEVAR